MKKTMVASTGETNLVVEVTDPEKAQKRIIIWGFIKSYHYTRSIDGEKISAFIQEHFPSTIENSSNPKVKIFFQGGDSSHNNVLGK